jgi:probable phosphoglycerate mutase
VIYLVRHGQTATNRDRRIQGQSDRELTDLGRQQAAALATALPPGAPIVCSPLRRARETAAALGEGRHLTIDARWIELDYGDFEGRLIDDVRPAIWDHWVTDPTWAPPNGESLASAATRVTDACEDLPMTEDVIVVTHVNPIKLAVAWAVGAPPQIVLRLFVELASITTVGLGASGQPVLRSFGSLPGSGTGGRAG